MGFRGSEAGQAAEQQSGAEQLRCTLTPGEDAGSSARSGYPTDSWSRALVSFLLATPRRNKSSSPVFK